MKNRHLLLLLAGFMATCLTSTTHAAGIPKVGDRAPDFSLKTLDDQTFLLGELTAKQEVVLVVLRGWPGYQCPVCDRQVHDFTKSADEFTRKNVRVVFIYPGPAEDLKAHAKEFQAMKNRQWPRDFLFVLDPDYTMVNAYGLRWDAPRETAYPSTFVLGPENRVRFAKVSHGHGDRTTAAGVLAEIKRESGK